MIDDELTALNGSGVLPEASREQLRAAARTPLAEHRPFARIDAIDQVVEHLRRAHPGYFRHDGWIADGEA